MLGKVLLNDMCVNWSHLGGAQDEIQCRLVLTRGRGTATPGRHLSRRLLS